jgi:hypothetical protein
MDQVLLAGFILCHCLTVVLTSFILYHDLVRWPSSGNTILEKALRTICHALQIVITCVAVGRTGIALHSGLQVGSMMPLFVSTFEVNVAMMVRCFLQHQQRGSS